MQKIGNYWPPDSKGSPCSEIGENQENGSFGSRVKTAYDGSRKRVSYASVVTTMGYGNILKMLFHNDLLSIGRCLLLSVSGKAGPGHRVQGVEDGAGQACGRFSASMLLAFSCRSELGSIPFSNLRTSVSCYNLCLLHFSVGLQPLA